MPDENSLKRSIARTQLTNELGQVLGIDFITKILANIDSAHLHIHEGETWKVGYAAEGFADNATIDFVVTIGSEPFHMISKIASGGNALFTIYEGPTFAGDGTPMTPRNLSRPHGDDNPPITVVRNPTVSVVGTELDPGLLPAGAGGNSGGNESHERDEFILNASTNYLIRLQNIAGNAQPMGMSITGYPHAIPSE